MAKVFKSARFGTLLFAILVTQLVVSLHSSDGIRLKEIYVVPILGHLDYGFTATQKEVESLWVGIYRDGIKFLEDNPEARLVSDALAPLDWFRSAASDDEWNRFATLVRSGRWELTAGYVHANTSVFSEAESARLFSDSRRWSDELGAPVKTWMHADVPGLAWNMAEAATDAGIEFIVVGANEMNGLSPLPRGLPRLFRWEAPDGEKIPVSLSGGSGYMEGGLDIALHTREGLEDRLAKFEDDLEKRDYRFDKVLVMFSSGDNNGPKILYDLMKTVRAWNAEGRSPYLRVGTTSEFYKAVEPEIEKAPVVRGDWAASGMWESLVRRSPHAERIAWEAKRKITAARLMAAITGDRAEAKRIEEIWNDLLLYDEHSGAGAWRGKLTGEQVREQNETEYLLAKNALDAVEDSLGNSSARLTGKDGVVCNISNARKSGFVEMSGADDGVYRDAVNYVVGVIPPWSCAAIGELKTAAAIANRERAYIEIETPLRARTPFFISPNVAGRVDPVRINSETSTYPLANGTSVLRLSWGPISGLKRAGSPVGIVGGFSLKSRIKKLRWGRGGVLFSSENDLRSADEWKIAGDGVVMEMVDGRKTVAAGLEGLPFSYDESNPREIEFLLYIQESPVELKGGEIVITPNEPGLEDSTLSHVWLVREATSAKENLTAFLENLSSPLEGFRKDAGAAEGRGSGVFKTFRSISPVILIEEVGWARFSDEIIVKIRNVSDKPVAGNIITSLGSIEKARRANAVEKDRGAAPSFGSNWFRAELGAFEVGYVGLTIKRRSTPID